MMLVELQSSFGAAVRTRRKKLGISQEELAGRAGLHRTYVADVERGARNLSLGSIAKLADALGVSIAALFSPESDAAHHAQEEMVEILLAENNPIDVKLTLKTFETANLINPVHIVRDGEEALEFVFGSGRYARRKDQDRPLLVLLDLKLPKVSGLKVLRQIKASEQTRTLPVVVLTDSRRGPELAESLRLGAEAYIVKPTQFDRFARIVPQLAMSWALLHPVHATAA